MKKFTSILLVISLILSISNLFAFAEVIVDNEASGGLGDSYGNVSDSLSDITIREFDSDYAVAYNDFENISGYKGISGHFIIKDTENPRYDTALSIPALGSATPGDSIYNGTYRWNGKTLSLFNEPLEVGEDYIFSYEYWSDPNPQPVGDQSPRLFNGGSFTAAPRHDEFIDVNKDHINCNTYFDDNQWHVDTVGFSATKDTLHLKVNTGGTYIHSYMDNYLIMKAAEVKLIDASECLTLEVIKGNFIDSDSSKAYNKKTTVALGDNVEFKLNSSTTYIEVDSVMMGDKPLVADENGVYKAKVTDDITIKSKANASLISENCVIDSNNNMYFKDKLSKFNFTDKVDANAKVFDAVRGDNSLNGDLLLSANDKLVCSVDDSISYTVKYIGDVAEGGDGRWNVSDITSLISNILGTETSQLDKIAFDINESGFVTVSDVVSLRNKILKSSQVYSPDEDLINQMNDFVDDILTRSGAGVTKQDLNNGIYKAGDRTRIANVIRKAMNGEPISIVYFGGSITEGGNWTATPTFATNITENIGYVGWVNKWFEEHFPDSQLTFHNVGISSTDTVLGIHRITEDVLAHEPDLVINEWSCNDSPVLDYKLGTYDAVLRKLYENDIAVLLYGFTTRALGGSSELHKKVANYYSVPFISYKDAFANTPNFSALTNDATHPNKVGHALTGASIANYLQNVYENIDNLSATPLELDSTPYHLEATRYDGAKIVDLYDVWEAQENGADGLNGVSIEAMGSFDFETELKSFGKDGYRSYYGATAHYAESYEPMVINIDSCKTLFILNMIYDITNDGAFYVELNGEKITNTEFNCSKVKKNDVNPEKGYHWPTPSIMYDESSPSVELKIYPDMKIELHDEDYPDATNRVTIFSLLLS